MKAHYKDIVKANESSIKYYLNLFNVEEKAIYTLYGFPEYAINSVTLETFTSGYYCKDSTYYHDSYLIYVMNCMIDYIYSVTRPDFTIDVRISDYKTGPVLLSIYVVRAYKIMKKFAKTKEETDLRDRLRNYLDDAAKGICNGGTITPNHRWMYASSALDLYSIVKNECLKKHAYAYLNEGVDIDEFGEYTERSPMYNKECDNALIIIARETKDDSYLEYVQKNLELMFNYMEPDFTMFTQNSNRKDKQEGDVSSTFYAHCFYVPYLYMGYLKKDARFAKMADDIFQHMKKVSGGGPNELYLYHMHPELLEYEPKMADYPTSFNIFHKDIVRRRNDDFSVTLLTRSPNFLFIQKGNLRCFVRICASFFMEAQFVPKEIEKIGEDKYYVTMTGVGKYHGPLPKKPTTTVWKELDHSTRPEINRVHLTYNITVSLQDSKVSLDIKTEGMDQVPYKVEFCFTAPCTVKNNEEVFQGLAGNHMAFKKGDIDVSKDDNVLRITNTHNSHVYHDVMRGSVPKSANSFTIYYTGFTNIDKGIEILAL